MGFHPITGAPIVRCSTCHGSVPDPNGCWECNPQVLGEKYAELREEHSGCEDSEWCPVCSGDCDDCETKDDEIAELREALDKMKAEAMNLCSLLEARSDVKARRDWAKFARERIEAIDPDADESPPAREPIPVEEIEAGRRDRV